MFSAPVIARFRAYGIWRYLLALAVAALAVLWRSLLEAIAPGIAYLVVLLPAVVIAGVFWGTLPAIVAATTGAIAIGALFLKAPLMAWPPFNSAQVDVLTFIPACAAVLWATRAQRRSAAGAEAAEGRLAEVFRQIPGAAAILEAPTGRLLLRSSQSDIVLAQPDLALGHSSDLGAYGGVHPDGRPFAAGDYPILRALTTGEVVRGEHVRYRRAGRCMVDLEVHVGPVRAADGRIVAAVGMAFDASERMQAERRLRESEAEYRAAAERLRAAVDLGNLGLWELDLTTRQVTLDACLAAMLGLPAQPIHLTQAELLRFADPSDQARASAIFTEGIAAGEGPAPEIRMVTAQNEQRWFVTRGTLLPEAGKVVGVIRDVTQRHERELALRAALDAREILVREADHRIKNSLQLVTSLLRLQLNRVADQGARDTLAAALARVEAVSDAHLALQSSPDLKSIELDTLLSGLCNRLAMLNPAVTLRCDARALVWLDAAIAIPLGLIVSELLTNALRHAYQPGVSGDVALTAVSTHRELTVTIADGGAGRPAGPVRPGLGTTVTNALARQIGAAIQADSAAGRGMTIVVHMALPAAPAPA